MNEPLEDITGLRPVFEIGDYYLYMIGGVVGILVLILAAYLLYRFFRRPKVDLRAQYIAEYESIDLNDAKHAAYAITRYTRLIAASEREEKMAAKLASMLEGYKYAKEVPPLSEEVCRHYEIFLGMVHE